MALGALLIAGCAQAGAGGNGGGTDGSGGGGEEPIASRVVAPIITPVAGVHHLTADGRLTVTIGSATADAEIYYTLDSTSPTNASIRYSGPFLLNGSTVIHAVATRNGLADSEIIEAIFTIREATESVAAPVITPPAGVDYMVR